RIIRGSIFRPPAVVTRPPGARVRRSHHGHTGPGLRSQRIFPLENVLYPLPTMFRALLIVLLLIATGCSWLKPQPTPILPAAGLYQLGESALDKKRYPESRYPTDALAKLEVCRGRLAQKEVWVAAYYMNQGSRSGARQRLEKVIKDYPRAPVMPEALSLLADVNFSEGRDKEAVELLR